MTSTRHLQQRHPQYHRDIIVGGSGSVPFDIQQEESDHRFEDAGGRSPPRQQKRQPQQPSGLEEEVRYLRDEVAKQPQLELTIKHLKKQLEVANDTVEMATARDVRPGSHYRYEIAGLNKSLVEKQEIIQEQEMAIAKLMGHFKRHPTTPSSAPPSFNSSSSSSSSSASSTACSSSFSQTFMSHDGTTTAASPNTSVCSSLMDDDKSDGSSESPQRGGMMALKAEGRKLKAENERLRNQETSELDDLRKRLAVSSRQLQIARKQEQTSRRESRLLEEQVLVLKGELSALRGSTMNVDRKGQSSTDNDFEEDELMNSVPNAVGLSHEKTRHEIEMEQELVRLKQSLVVKEGEVKKLQNSLWITKIRNENKTDLAEEIDRVRKGRKDTEHELAGTQTIIQRQKADIREKNETILLMSEQLERLKTASKSNVDEVDELEQRRSTDPSEAVPSNLSESLRNVKRELRELRITFGNKERQLLEESKNAMDKLQSTSDDLIAMKQEVIKKDSDISKLKLQLGQSPDSTAHECARELKEPISKLQNTARESSKETCILQEELASLEAAKKQLETDYERCVDELKDLRLKSNDLADELKAIKVSHEEAIELSREKDDNIVELKQINANLSRHLDELKVELNRLSNNPFEHNKNDVQCCGMDELQNESGEANNNNPIYQKTHEALILENFTLSEKIQQLSREIAVLERRIAGSPEDESEAAKRLEEIQVEHARSLASISMNSQVTIDTLRKDLVSAREKCAEEVAILTASLSMVQDENHRLKILCESTELKDQRIFALEQTLFAQEVTVDSLRSEISQLHSNFSRAATDRRSEMEQMRSDIVEQATLVKERELEIQSLLVELEQVKSKHLDEVNSLQERIKNLEMETPLSRTMRNLQQANIVVDVKERLESLKVTNIQLKEENVKLTSRLERAQIKLRSIDAEQKMNEETGRGCHELRSRGKANKSLRQHQTVECDSVGSGSDEDSLNRGEGNVPTILYIDPSAPQIDEDL